MRERDMCRSCHNDRVIVHERLCQSCYEDYLMQVRA